MNIDIVKYIVMGVLLVCGYFFLLHTMTGHMSGKKGVFGLALVLFFVYAAIAIPLMIILNQMGNSNFVLLALLLLLSCFVLFTILYNFIRDFRELNEGMLVLFILYVLMVSYITIFSRSEGHSRAILLRMDSFQEAIRNKSLEPLNHVMLNAAMFIPIGILFPLINPERLGHILYVGPLGLTMSTLIEATQMFFQIGQCDAEDIVANTAGAVIGVILFKLYWLLFKNRYEEYDDEEEEEEEEA